MADLSARPGAPASSPTPRRLSAAKAARVAQLHRECREDYASNAARRAQDHRDDAHLIAAAAEAVATR